MRLKGRNQYVNLVNQILILWNYLYKHQPILLCTKWNKFFTSNSKVKTDKIILWTTICCKYVCMKLWIALETNYYN